MLDIISSVSVDIIPKFLHDHAKAYFDGKSHLLQRTDDNGWRVQGKEEVGKCTDALIVISQRIAVLVRVYELPCRNPTLEQIPIKLHVPGILIPG